MAMSFDQIEKRLAEQAKTARALKEKLDALKSAQEQTESVAGRTPSITIPGPSLPLTQVKR